MVNNKGQQMTLTTIIVIVLGIAVLVFLIFGFSTGWNALWDQVTVGTSSSNVELKITDCESDCTAEEESAWCNEKKDLKFFKPGEDKIVKVKGSCFQFDSGGLDEDYSEYDEAVGGLGFKDCAAFSCADNQ